MSSGGGGGSSSGEISYPEYMEGRHDDWLAAVTTAMTDARSGASPYASWTTVDPAAVFGPVTIDAFSALSALGDQDLDDLFGDSYSSLAGHDVTVPEVSDSEIAAAVAADNDLLTSEANRTLIPAFEAGMRDANAIQSSAFVVGKALILGDVAKKVAAFDADLRTKSFALKLEAARLKISQVQGKHETAMKLAMGKQEKTRQVTVLSAEIGRIYAAARLEADKTTVEMSAKDRLFDLSTFQYGNNVMGAIGGGVASTNQEGSIIQSALGGAMSGAAGGAALAGIMGATGGAAAPFLAAGAALGLAGGLLK